jgi:hypothetical protein
MNLINTERELVGAEEGAGEMERAIGKAKAMGRNFRRLARQLARARRGMKRFRLAQQQAGGGGNGGLRIADCGLSDRTDATEATDPASLHNRGLTAPDIPGEGGRISSSAGASAFAGPSTFTGLTVDRTADQTADRHPAGTGEDGGWEGGLGQDSAMSGPDGGTGGGQGTVGEGEDGGEGPPTAEQATVAAAEPVTMAWDAAAARRELAAMVREALEAHETARSREENSAETEGRMAAMEQRLNRLESRANLNREGG